MEWGPSATSAMAETEMDHSMAGGYGTLEADRVDLDGER